MRRFRFTLFAVMALLAVVPASALARGHHQRSHRHHVHARIERFGDVRASNDSAGTIKSFTDGVLEISLADGSTVRGRVTGDTELECMASVREDISRDGGGDQGGDRDRGSGDDHRSGDGHRGGGDQGDDEGRGDDGDEPEDDQACSMADLTPGASVHEAELGVSGAGAVWRTVELGA